MPEISWDDIHYFLHEIQFIRDYIGKKCKHCETHKGVIFKANTVIDKLHELNDRSKL